jgi:hypothetical protein
MCSVILFQESFHGSRILISTDPQDIQMFLFTRRNPAKPSRLLVNDTLSRKSHFDSSKVTKILIHGFSAGMYFAHRFINGKRLDKKKLSKAYMFRSTFRWEYYALKRI